MEQPSRPITVALIGAVAVIMAATITVIWTDRGEETPPQCELASSSAPEGCITIPAPGSKVNPEFTVAGRLDNIPTDSHVWVATKIRDQVWPREPEVQIGPAFDVTVVEGGSPDGFSLVLLLVSDAKHKEIQDWLRSDEQPGILMDSGMTLLDTVPNLQLH